MKSSIKVAIADTNSLFRTGVRAVLSQQESVAITSEISSIEQLETLFSSADVPDVLIASLSLSKGGSLDFLTEMGSKYPNTPIVAIGTFSEEAYAARVLRAGAAAYLKSDCSPADLIEAVTVVRTGRMFLTTKASASVIEQLQNRKGYTIPHAALSDREYQIFTMICKGMPLVKIGEGFGISVKTVSTYRARILKKMNMQNNSELIQYAVKHEMIEQSAA